MTLYAQAAASMHGPRIFCRGCQGDVMSRSDLAYCRDCHAIYEECKAARDARIRRQQPSRQQIAAEAQASFYRPRHKRVGVSGGDVLDYDGLTEVDWQDALHPNEGDR